MEPTPPVSAFAEDDARLAGMHGYEPGDVIDTNDPVGTAKAMNAAQAAQAWADRQPVTQGEFRRLEAKLDSLILALKAGAIGRWQ